MQISDKQEKFIQSLIDQLGYKDSPFKSFFLDRINLNNASIEHASHLIENLIEENKKRKYNCPWT